MSDKTKIFLIRSWTIGMVVVLVHYLMGLQHLTIGIFLGIINTIIIDYYIETIKYGNQGDLPKGRKLIYTLLINLLISITISLSIRAIDYGLIKANLVEIPIEPFRFIFIYQIIYYGFKWIFTKILKTQGEGNIS